MDDGAPFLSLYVLSVIVMQAGVTCTSFYALHSLKVATGEKQPRPGARTRGLRSNAEFQPHEPPVWPRFFTSNRCIYLASRSDAIFIATSKVILNLMKVLINKV